MIEIHAQFGQAPHYDLNMLGRAGEHGTRQIVFDCADALREYPNARIICAVLRPRDTTPYPAELTGAGDTRILTLTRVETYLPGLLKLELRAVDGERVLKSALYAGRITESLQGDGDKPGNPLSDALNRLESTIADAQTLADEIRQKLDNGEFVGERGPQGEKGDKGEKGEQGDKGEQGEKGEPGERGANGADAPQIDDNAVSANTPWSSQRIVNTLCQEVTASGNPVACTPVKDSPLGIKVLWAPTQTGSGTPSPTNIRPITGRESVTLSRYGRNMLDMSRVTISDAAYGLIVASDGDIITINGTATNTGHVSFEILRVGQPELNGTNVKIQAFCSKGVISGIYGLRTKSESAIAVIMDLVEGTSYDVVFRVTVSAETLTEYVPYDSNSTSQTLTLSSTIYGGSVDVATATGEETWQLLPLDGNTVKFASSAAGDYWNLPAGSAPGIVYGGPESTLCSHFHQVFSGNPNGFLFTKPERFTGTFDTIDALNAYISAQYAAGTPVTIAYKLAAPTHYQVTGIGEVTALAGVNTISTDADQVTVTWHEAVRADVKDVQVNGTSILTNGVANIPKAEPGKLGLTSCYNPWVGGLYVGTDGIMRIVQAPTTDIDSRANAPRPVTGNNLDYAVKAAMCDGKGAAWTSAEQAAARSRMGLDKSYELIEEITLTEKVTRLIRNAEPNGTAYHFKKMYVDIITPQAEENGSIYSLFNNILIGLALGCIKSQLSEGGIAQIYANVADGFLDGYGVGGGNQSTSSNLIRYITPSNAPSEITAINSMDILGTVDIPINTNIKIYGVRA